MKTFKIYYEYRIKNNTYNDALESNYHFLKAKTEKQAVDLFKSNFRPDAKLNITSVECY